MIMTEESITFFRDYLGLLDTLEEAFDYILSKEMMEQPDAMVKMLPNIISGWDQINKSHRFILENYGQSEAILKCVDHYYRMVSKYERDVLVELNIFSTELLTKMSQAFSKWRKEADSTFISFVAQ
ncbi:hypothetical protein [Terrilactibacillus laevilacticus]|uniref:DUF8042 domain-containing protein n=1 Tax=Terrilactibacillus laevilacticus TaxID=1380157 RepID=A0ABW5PMX8_9BACI|nr:hypothetical protein [Terrilactibacillus laevilacticus]